MPAALKLMRDPREISDDELDQATAHAYIERLYDEARTYRRTAEHQMSRGNLTTARRFWAMADGCTEVADGWADGLGRQ